MRIVTQVYQMDFDMSGPLGAPQNAALNEWFKQGWQTRYEIDAPHVPGSNPGMGWITMRLASMSIDSTNCEIAGISTSPVR